MKQDTMRTIGCDLGDRTSHLCVLSPEGAVLKRSKLASTTRAFEAFFSGLEPARIVLEVGAHSRWSSALLTELGHQCIVANPRYVRLIYAGTHKNDRLDAEALARLGRLDPTLLRPIVHRRQQTQAELGVLRARDVLVRTRTRLIVAARDMARAQASGLRPANPLVPKTFPLSPRPRDCVVVTGKTELRLVKPVARWQPSYGSDPTVHPVHEADSECVWKCGAKGLPSARATSSGPDPP